MNWTDFIPERGNGPGLAGLILILGLLTGLWFAFGADDASAVVIGVPVVLLALWAAVRLAPTRVPRISPIALAEFFPIFVVLSLLGGVDVARRAFSRRVALDPAMVTYDLRLPHGTPRFTFVLLISLLPGTLSAALEDDTLTVHVLDKNMDNEAALARLEARVAQIFRTPLESPGDAA